MFQKVRKKIIKKAIIKIIVCIVIIIVTMLVSDMAPIKMIKGPEKIDINDIDLDEYKGKYVEAEIAYVYDYFLEEETYTEFKNGSRSPGEITARYYITDVNLSQYIALLADGDTLMDEFEDLMDKTHLALDNDTEPKAVSYKGTFTKLSGEEYLEFKSFMMQVGLSEDMHSDYIFKVNYVGDTEESFAIISCVVIILAILFAFMSLIRALSNRYTKDAKKFAVNNGLTFEQLSMELDRGNEISNVWITPKYTAYIKGNKVRILMNQDYIWAYYKETRTTRRGVTSVTSQIALVNRNKKYTLITISSEDAARYILNVYAETQPQMVLGFNDDLQKLFKKNFDQFLVLPYQREKSNDEIAPSEEFVPESYVPEGYIPEAYSEGEETGNNNHL